jgi:predicted nucleotidyltransferase
MRRRTQPETFFPPTVGRERVMSKQQDALPFLVQRCSSVDPNCGIQLQGSLARGTERDDSDVDLTVVLDPAAPAPRFNEFLNPQNHGGMIRVWVDRFGVNVDINWIYESDLVALSHTSAALGWYMFAIGRPLYDPQNRAQRCQDSLRKWFDAHPEILRAWEAQQVAVNRHKHEPGHALEFPTQPAFCAHLRHLLGEAKVSG